MTNVLTPFAPFITAMRTVRKADPRGAALAGVLQLGGALSGLGVVLASKLAIDAVSDASPAADLGLALPLALLALSVALSQSLAVVQQLQQRVMSERVRQFVWEDLLTTTTAVGLARWQRTDFMDHLERVRTNALQRPTAVVTSLFSLLGAVIGSAALTAALFAFHPALVPLLLLAGVPAVLVSRRVSRLEFRHARSANPLVRRQMYLRDILSNRTNAAEVRAMGAAPYLLRRHRTANEEHLSLLEAHVRRRRRLALVSTAASVITLGATFAFIGFLLNSGRLSLAAAGAAAIGARLLSGQLTTVFASVATLLECGPFLLDLEKIHELRDQAELATGRRRTLRQSLRLDRVHYTYPGQRVAAVNGVSLVIPRGKVVALVGENGSGKSTLAKIAAGLFPPDSGRVLWDDSDDVSMADIRASVSVMFQDFVRYQMTARDNIAIARAGQVEQRLVREAADRARVGPVIESLSQGYDTMLGLELAEGGDLSGGQWQRLALARAFYRDSPLVVLDEPTSALDPKAEWELFRDVRRVLDGRAALLITHRYSSARLADYIYVMGNGVVIEQGTHDVLLALPRGRYAELYRLQAAAYLAGTPGAQESQDSADRPGAG